MDSSHFFLSGWFVFCSFLISEIHRKWISEFEHGIYNFFFLYLHNLIKEHVDLKSLHYLNIEEQTNYSVINIKTEDYVKFSYLNRIQRHLIKGYELSCLWSQMTFKTHRVFLSVEKQISYSYTGEHNKKLVFKIHVLSILLLKYLLNIPDIVCALISQFANINKLNIQLFLLMTFSFFF